MKHQPHLTMLLHNHMKKSMRMVCHLILPTKSKMTTRVSASATTLTLMVKSQLVNTASCSPMAAPRLSPTPLTTTTSTKLRSNTKARQSPMLHQSPNIMLQNLPTKHLHLHIKHLHLRMVHLLTLDLFSLNYIYAYLIDIVCYFYTK